MRYKRVGLKISNVLLSAGAVAIFFYLLVLAMAQEQVVAGWSRAPDFKNYNSSLIQASKADEADQRVQQIADQKQKDAVRTSRLEADAALAARAYSRALVRIEPIVLQFKKAGNCQILSEPPLEVLARAEAPVATDKAEAQRLADQKEAMAEQAKQVLAKEAEMASLRACLGSDTKIKKDVRDRYVAALDDAEALADRVATIDARRQRLAQRTKQIGAESWAKRLELEKSVELRAHYRALDALSGPDWFPIRLTHFPPFIIHVMLSFFSGTFGALLITMVFLVYPSKLRERISAKLYYKRIFLGGLVAVTVFIVLAGGASILGTGQGAQVGTNFMSFTAIGLLAGMFSDTVADWLSARAKTMFKIEEEEEAEDRQAGAAGTP
jgi:hypothetical protein